MKSKLKQYRIIKHTLRDGSFRFLIQYKYYGLFKPWKFYDEVSYDDHQKILNRINNIISCDNKTHSIDVIKTEILK